MGRFNGAYIDTVESKAELAKSFGATDFVKAGANVNAEILAIKGSRYLAAKYTTDLLQPRRGKASSSISLFKNSVDHANDTAHPTDHR